MAPPPSRSSSRRRPLLGALMTGLLLLGTPSVAATPKKKPTTTKKKASAPKKSSKESLTLRDDAAALIKGKQYPEAQALTKRCIDADPSFAECHMLRGAALAGMTDWEEAAKEYRTFLNLAPDHPLAPKVRQTLENYEQAQAPAP
ncbi:hypothetical protein [Hyalangium versicolor]|uniref:hypothetical protein n=1 Tax=Hyalangium versicolor TaxID=2861190 RepID=UPI001CCD6146|nr:hypothetical protein [Hyalangium versicolor]